MSQKPSPLARLLGGLIDTVADVQKNCCPNCGSALPSEGGLLCEECGEELGQVVGNKVGRAVGESAARQAGSMIESLFSKKSQGPS